MAEMSIVGKPWEWEEDGEELSLLVSLEYFRIRDSGAECSSHSSQKYSILDYFLNRQPVPRIYINPTVFGPKLSTTIPYISTNPPAPPY